MDKKFARGLVSYIEQTNGLLEKYAEANERLSQENEMFKADRNQFQVKLAEAIEVMANDGRIPKDYTEAVFNSMKNSPEKAAEFLTKVNDQPGQMGESAKGMISSTDPIVDFCFSD